MWQGVILERLDRSPPPEKLISVREWIRLRERAIDLLQTVCSHNEKFVYSVCPVIDRFYLSIKYFY